MKIFTSLQTKEIDRQTIINEPINSIDLMERAANNIANYLLKEDVINNINVIIITGIGNNGGDGLALARILFNIYKINLKVYHCNFSSKESVECKINLNLLQNYNPGIITIIDNDINIDIDRNSIIIDCIFGRGLSRSVENKYKALIDYINRSGSYIISIDIPSGLFCKKNNNNEAAIICANKTYCLETPPLSAMFVENYKYFGEIVTIPIGLCPNAKKNTNTNYHIIDAELVSALLKKRLRFASKWDFGHALLIAGSYSKAGAAILASMACMKSGLGLLTVHVPKLLNDIMQISIPEAMLSIDVDNQVFTDNVVLDKYSAIGIGPGLGTETKTALALQNILNQANKPVVIDADAINLLAKFNNINSYFKKGFVLTPHIKEFERLFGNFENTYERILFMQNYSVTNGVVLVLKGGITCISLPSGDVFFNTIGNAGMATAGAGDVLTGIITSLLAQGYTSENASIIAVYIHALAGDIAKEDLGYTALTATDIINHLYAAFKIIEKM